MARTQAADYDAKRDAITVHAARLFAAKGFAAASISELAERCKVSKSLIYHYYASKEAILFDVMSDHIDELLDAVETTDIDDKAPETSVHEVTRTLLQHYVGAADKQKVLLYELDSLPKNSKAEIVSKQRKIVARVEDIIVAAKPSFKKDRAALRAKTMLYFGMLNWTHTWFKPKGAISRDGLAEMAAGIILSAD